MRGRKDSHKVLWSRSCTSCAIAHGADVWKSLTISGHVAHTPNSFHARAHSSVGAVLNSQYDLH